MDIDKEVMQQLMYAILHELSRSKYTFVFKGALVLSSLMEKAEINSPSRLSRDIDGDIQGYVSIEDVVVELKRVFNKIGLNGVKIQKDARSTDTQYFFNILDDTDVAIFNIDLGLKVNPWHTIYQLKNGTVIYGQTIAKIFWDKICVVSTPTVAERPWDIFDMYLLSLRKDLRMSEILAVRDGTGRQLGDFQEFLYPSDRLKSRWKRRRYIKERPDFNVMFVRVRDLCTPFIVGGASLAVWDPAEGLWYEGESNTDPSPTYHTIPS